MISTTVHCAWHNGDIPAHQAQVIRAEEPGSGAGRPTYACDPCVRDNGLVPIAASSAFIGRRDAAPELPAAGRSS